MNRNTRRASLDDADLVALEQLLTHSLRPVEVRQDFRRGLHTQLARSPIPAKTRLTILQYVILSLGSVAAAALLLLAVVQAVRSILSAMGYLQSARRA